MPYAILISSDAQRFTMDLEIAKKMSNTLKSKLECSLEGYEDNPHMNAVANLPSIKGDIIRLVIEWCMEHKDMLTYEQKENGEFVFPFRSDKIEKWGEWDKQFVAVNTKQLAKLELAASYLKIYDLWIAIRVALGKGYFVWMKYTLLIATRDTLNHTLEQLSEIERQMTEQENRLRRVEAEFERQQSPDKETLERLINELGQIDDQLRILSENHELLHQRLDYLDLVIFGEVDQNQGENLNNDMADENEAAMEEDNEDNNVAPAVEDEDDIENENLENVVEAMDLDAEENEEM